MTYAALLVALVALAGCKPHPAATYEDTVVRFAGSGFSLQPGAEWLKMNTRRLAKETPGVIVCQPVLSGEVGMIQVVQLGDHIRDDQAMVQVLRTFESDENAIQESLAHWEFVSAQGHRVLAFQYARHAPGDPARVTHWLTQFVVRHRSGRWVSIAARTQNAEQAKGLEEMVQRTLRDIPNPNAPTPTPDPVTN